MSAIHKIKILLPEPYTEIRASKSQAVQFEGFFPWSGTEPPAARPYVSGACLMFPLHADEEFEFEIAFEIAEPYGTVYFNR